MSIAKLRVSTTIQHIYKLARDVAIVVDFIRDKPKCLRIMKDILKIAYFARKTRACIPTHSLFFFFGGGGGGFTVWGLWFRSLGCVG